MKLEYCRYVHQLFIEILSTACISPLVPKILHLLYSLQGMDGLSENRERKGKSWLQKKRQKLTSVPAVSVPMLTEAQVSSLVLQKSRMSGCVFAVVPAVTFSVWRTWESYFFDQDICLFFFVLETGWQESQLLKLYQVTTNWNMCMLCVRHVKVLLRV